MILNKITYDLVFKNYHKESVPNENYVLSVKRQFIYK